MTLCRWLPMAVDLEAAAMEVDIIPLYLWQDCSKRRSIIVVGRTVLPNARIWSCCWPKCTPSPPFNICGYKIFQIWGHLHKGFCLPTYEHFGSKIVRDWGLQWSGDCKDLPLSENFGSKETRIRWRCCSGNSCSLPLFTISGSLYFQIWNLWTKGTWASHFSSTATNFKLRESRIPAGRGFAGISFLSEHLGLSFSEESEQEGKRLEKHISHSLHKDRWWNHHMSLHFTSPTVNSQAKARYIRTCLAPLI